MLAVVSLLVGTCLGAAVWPINPMIGDFKFPTLELREKDLVDSLLQFTGLSIEIENDEPEFYENGLPRIKPIKMPGLMTGSVLLIKNYWEPAHEALGEPMYTVMKRHPSLPIDDLKQQSAKFPAAIKDEKEIQEIVDLLKQRKAPPLVVIDGKGLTTDFAKTLSSSGVDIMLLCLEKDEHAPLIGRALAEYHLESQAARSSQEHPAKEDASNVADQQQKQEDQKQKQQGQQLQQEGVQPKSAPLDPRLVPEWFNSRDECNSQTNLCSSHGNCVQIGEKWRCSCLTTNAGARTIKWAGNACQKKDVSWQFNLLLWTSLAVIFAIGAGVSLLTSVGNEPLPGILKSADAGAQK